MQSVQPERRFPQRIGLGTWEMGVASAQRTHEVAAIEHALAVGYRLIDTAEMYAKGGAERVIGQALKNAGTSRRSELFIVSKVLPDNASRKGCARACEASIERMGCDYLDLYLLHWPGSHPFSETLQGFADLLSRGLIRNFGVSNLDVAALQQWYATEDALGIHSDLKCNQIYYCAEARSSEFELQPWQRARGIQTMAYSPLGRGSLARDPALARIGQQRGATAAQIALAWSIREPDVMAIPKSVDPRRIEQNLEAASLQLTSAELASIDARFPPPKRRQALQTI